MPRIFARKVPDPAATPVRKKPSLDFSVTGLVYSCMMMFMGLAAINSQANLLFGVFGLMIGVLLVSGWMSKTVLKRLQVHREMPESASVGQPTTIIYHFRNDKRFWPSLSVALGELDGCEGFSRQPFTYLLHAAAKMSASVPTEVIPKRRGLHILDAHQVSTSFPFGFIKRAVIRRERESLLIHPAIAEVDPKLLTLARSAEKTGATMRPRKGGADEFYGLKEYRRGENTRMIYWRRSARTGTLVSKEMTQVAPPRLLLLVDTYLEQRSTQRLSQVERTIAMAASLASHALEKGLTVGLYAWSDRWVGLAAGRGKRHRRDVLGLLARLPLNTEKRANALIDAGRELMEPGTTMVLLTPEDLTLGLADAARGSMLVISAASEQSRRWFRFGSGVDFDHCMPPDQEPKSHPNS